MDPFDKLEQKFKRSTHALLISLCSIFIGYLASSVFGTYLPEFVKFAFALLSFAGFLCLFFAIVLSTEITQKDLPTGERLVDSAEYESNGHPSVRYWYTLTNRRLIVQKGYSDSETFFIPSLQNAYECKLTEIDKVENTPYQNEYAKHPNALRIVFNNPSQKPRQAWIEEKIKAGELNIPFDKDTGNRFYNNLKKEIVKAKS